MFHDRERELLGFHDGERELQLKIEPMAMVAAALRREVKRVVTVRSSILYDKCMHLGGINDQSLQRTFSYAYKKPDAGYSECRIASVAKFSTARGGFKTTVDEEAKAKQCDEESGKIRRRAMPCGIGNVMICTGTSRSAINARQLEGFYSEREPALAPTVAMDCESYTCDSECVVHMEFQVRNLMFLWPFLVMPSDSKWDMVMGADWMNHVGSLGFDLIQGPITISMPHGPYVVGDTRLSTALREEFDTETEDEAEAEQGHEESSLIEKNAVIIGDNFGPYDASVTVRSDASHSVINVRTAKALCLETIPIPPTIVTVGWESHICNTKCVIDWHMYDLKFTWTFLVMPLTNNWDIVLGVDWMKHVSFDIDFDRGSATISMPDGPYELRVDGSSSKLKTRSQGFTG